MPQLVVAVVAERPQGIVAGLSLLPNQQQQAAVTLALTPADLPSRVEAPSIASVWQDIDLNLLELRPARGPAGLAGSRWPTSSPEERPDPPRCRHSRTRSSRTGRWRRPTSRRKASPASGELPDTAADVPAPSGDLIAGRTLASAGDRVVAAERSYGSGLVTIIGFDLATPWITETLH